MTTEPTKPLLLRLPERQIEQLDIIRSKKALKNVQTLIYRLIEQELLDNENSLISNEKSKS